MCHNWITQNIVEHARERQAALHKEADRQRLLLQIGQQAPSFVLLRKAVLFLGNLLITSGTWLQARATLEQHRITMPTMLNTGTMPRRHR